MGVEKGGVGLGGVGGWGGGWRGESGVERVVGLCKGLCFLLDKAAAVTCDSLDPMTHFTLL